jgi:hypothetical protein
MKKPSVLVPIIFVLIGTIFILLLVFSKTDKTYELEKKTMYLKGYSDYQRGYLPPVYEKGIIKELKRNPKLRSKFRG